MKKKKNRLVLLDAHAIIHRAYHALPQFSTRKGFPTGAIYGFVSMILKIIDDFHPDFIVAAYDLPKPTFRHDAFDEYKGKRAEADESLKIQISHTRDFCSIFSIPIYDAEAFEADDIIGTIVEQTKNEDLEIIIASGDMDTLQLVEGERVTVFTLRRGMSDTIRYNEKKVVERFGFVPSLIVDYKALRGDPSDNIPGIRGIGEKSAKILVQKFGTIENLYQILETRGEDFFIQNGIKKRIVKLLQEGKEDAEFSKILATIRRDAPIHFSLPSSPWFHQVEVEEVIRFFEKYEFHSLPQRFLKTLENEGVTNVLSKKDISLRKEEGKEDEEKLLPELSTILHLLDSDEIAPGKERILSITNTKRLSDARDVLLAELSSYPKLTLLFENIEKPLIPIVKKMQKNGIRVDVSVLQKLSEEYKKELKNLEEKIFTFVGEEFNVNSPQQLSHILFEVLQLPTKGVRKSKTGSYSTNSATLEKLEGKSEIIPLIIEYRELQKLISTYLETLPQFIASDGRIHAEFLQNGTATGRFSSRNPNLQNIPIRSKHGKKIRQAFVTEKGNIFISFDYSQIELRILALLSHERSLIQLFQEGKDIHRAVAARIAGVSENEVDAEMRRKAKIVNFGILYGMGIRSLQKEMKSSKEEAERFYHGFFQQFPQVASFLEETKKFAYEHGYTETLFGRRRQFKSIRSPLPYIRAMAERMALNAPIQGTAADIIKLAMVKIEEEIVRDFPSAKLVLQIHDEIIYEIDEARAEAFSQKAEEIMERVLEDSYLKYKSEVPLLVHIFHGKSWEELK